MTAKLKLFTELLVFVILIIVFSAEAKPKNYSRTTSRKSGYMREHLLAFYIMMVNIVSTLLENIEMWSQ